VAQRQGSAEEGHRLAALVQHRAEARPLHVTFHDELPVEVGKLQDRSYRQSLL
jgi:hypothetical protein